MKSKILVSSIALIMLFTLAACGKQETGNENAIKFKEEYEFLNGKTSSNDTIYRSISIDEDNPFIYATAKEIVEKIQNKETFYVYFGSSYCPWCRSVIEKAMEVAIENNIDTIYYVDIWDGDHVEILRDRYQLNENGEIELISKGTDEYHILLEYFDNILSDYNLSDSDGNSVPVGEKRIFAPNFIYIENGIALKLEDGISSKQTNSRMEFTDEILQDEETKFNEFFTSGLPSQ